MSYNSLDVTDFENMMSLDNDIKTKVMPRWERKARQQQSNQVQQPSQSDRYIPSRSGMEYDLSTLSSLGDDIGDDSDHAKLIMANTLESSRVLSYKNKAPVPSEDHQSSLKVLYSCQGAKKEVVKPSRHINSAPFKILDAPDMLDDYYLNLMSWGSNNLLAVALSQSVYLWNPASGETKELMNLCASEGNYVSSLSWIQSGNHIAIGTADNTVQLWDVEMGRQVRQLRGHSARVGALSWNNHVLSSGSKDNSILHHDVRLQNNVVGKMLHHTQEVCGLSWSPDGMYLASGANDNTLCIQDFSSIQNMDITPRHVLTDHQAAVKALAWSPHERNLLASGGGTADRCIKFWNASSGSLVNSIDTGSQVCALQWSPYEKEILSSHGYADNQLCLWKYPSMLRVKELKGHTSRVLHMAQSTDGSIVCTGAADETLRFWNIFAPEGKKRGDGLSASASNPVKGLKASGSMKIR